MPKIKIFFAVLTILFFSGILGTVKATTLISEDFNDRAFSSVIQVYNEPNYCTGTGCPYSTVSRGGSGYSLQGSHDVSGYNMIVAFADDPIIYMNQGVYIRYYVYFPSSYQFVAECGGTYNNQKILKFAGSSGGVPDIEIIWADCIGLLGGTTSQMGIVKLQYTKEDGGAFGIQGYNMAAGHFIEKDRWNKIEFYIYVPSYGSSNSIIKMAVNDATAFNLTNQPINKGSYDGALQLVSLRVNAGGSCPPASGHGTWYMDDLKIVYGEGDLTGSDGTGDTTPPSTPTGLSATAVSYSQINLSWTAATDNVGVTGYRIYRNGTYLASTTGTAYSDAGLSPSTTYTYRVSAYDAAGNEGLQSSPASATTSSTVYRLLSDDFEEGGSWTYGTHWNLYDYLWIITSSNPHGGTYCAEATWNDAVDHGDASSRFEMSLNGGNGYDELFIRYWAKFPTTFYEGRECGCNSLRFMYGGSTEAEFDMDGGAGGHWRNFYSWGSAWDLVMTESKDNQWHEYAIYYKMSNPLGTGNGIFRTWKDQTVYTVGTASDNFTNVVYGNMVTRLVMPWYFKQEGPGEGHYTWWIDDIEIWDGMPSAYPDTTPPVRSAGSPTGTLPAGTTSTTLSLITDEPATCKYSTTPGTSYSSMVSTFSGAGTTYHSTTISGLSNGIYNYYVRCQDTAGNANSNDYTITFSVASSSSPIISVDSTYPGYSTSVIDDGIINATGGTSTTWASDESPTLPHWVAINFSSPTQINYANMWWAYNSQRSRPMTSQRVDIQYWNGSSYATAASLLYPGADVANSSASFPAVTTTSLRFYQPANMGNPSYSTVLWITELDYGSYHKSDQNCNNCVEMGELNAFIDRWKINNQDVTIRELIEAIGLWKRGCS